MYLKECRGCGKSKGLKLIDIRDDFHIFNCEICGEKNIIHKDLLAGGVVFAPK